MTRAKVLTTLLVLIAAPVFFHSPAEAQVSPPGRTALENAGGGAVRGRSPGNLVSAGVARAIEFTNTARAGVRITDTSRPTSVRAQALADSITILFNQLNQAIAVFHNLLLARAGRPPSVPIATGTAPATGGGGSNIGNIVDQLGGRR